ncbi:hypothetical protein PVBG_03266 [Plasmodium vivax Brazil I]|uniref:Splicing factor Cactin n=1 Tax=Plasmodium vivax (strain Brazil I) TaxID=1033975 RepID=A0A0J9T2C5_PLAV1|nr:hypothetical protein PVBG_03266 [Plasmodium vivax Brazil I]
MSDSSDGEDSSGGVTHKGDECRKKRRRREGGRSRERRGTSRGRRAKRGASSSSASSAASSASSSAASPASSSAASPASSSASSPATSSAARSGSSPDESPNSVSSSPSERRRGKRRSGRSGRRGSSERSERSERSESSERSYSHRSSEERVREKAKRRKSHRKGKDGRKSKRKQTDTDVPAPPCRNTLTVKELKKERENLMQKHFNYTDECNPFGDNSLSTPFVWKLKNKYEQIKHDRKVKVTTTSLLQNSLSKISEIEEVKKRRQERDNERALLEDYRLQLEKQRNQINIKEYLQKEQLFFINQQIKSSDSRIDHNLLQLPDVFRLAAKIVNREQVKRVRPALYRVPFHVLLEGQTERELENCAKQIKLLLQHDELENGGKFRRYWESLLFFCEHYLGQLHHKEQPASEAEEREVKNVLSKTERQIQAFLEHKNYDELVTYEEKIKEKVVSQCEEVTDQVYWNRVLLKIPFFKAKNVLVHFHAKLRKRISLTGAHSEDSDSQAEKAPRREHPAEEDEARGKAATTLPFECHSPQLIHPESLTQMGIPAEARIYTAEEELQERGQLNEDIWCTLRRQGGGKSSSGGNSGGNSGANSGANSGDGAGHFHTAQADAHNSAEQALLKKLFTKDQEVYNHFVQREKRKGRVGEITMKDVSHHHHSAGHSSLPNHLRSNLPVSPSSLLITRKPLYFNRIKTSFDWNKYNKTHYDYENTPPKYICGYKFNIFYLNLLNKKEKPSWKLHPTDDESKVLIVFHGGPPYLDIAFQIVNAEWSYDKHRGFRNVFDRGILQLYFNFKKKRYRR